MRLAVIGHVEWVTFTHAPFVPRPGEIVHLSDPLDQPGAGGTVSAGLFLNLDREVATRYSFLLAIPAVLASGLFSLPDAFSPDAGQAASGAQLSARAGPDRISISSVPTL